MIKKMRTTVLVISILAGVLVMCTIFMFVGNSRSATVTEVNDKAYAKNPGTIYVGSGPGNDSATIQGGINLASADDTIFIWSGTYYENVIINKTITLIGEDKNTTIIDGGPSKEGDVIYINASLVNIDNFTIRNGWHNDCGVNICASSDNHITNCNILNNEWGIYLGGSSNDLITNCVILNNERGIVLATSSNNTVSYCDIDSNNTSNSEGIILAYSANNNTITNCSVYNNICVGIHLEYTSNNNLISNCIISNTTQHGFYIYHSSSNFISSCDISYNSVNGMVLWQSSNNYIINCIISNNEHSGCYIFELSSNNSIYHNNFINNTNNAHDECTNYWDYNGGGNYWGDYTGSDANNDGIGDTPYNISGGTNQDHYPFMHPSGWEIVSGLTPHAPIYINGNSNFTAENGVVSGNGTAGKPYIIEGWDINASQRLEGGIYIKNTNVYFIIRNCVIHSGRSNYTNGILFEYVQNSKIDNVTSYDNSPGNGIIFGDSSNNTIINCTVYNNGYGITLFSSNNQVTNCVIYNNYNAGIYLWYSSNNNITNCTIYYNNLFGISLFFSSNNRITDSTVYNNTWGIGLSYSPSNTITNCAIYNNSKGIPMHSSPNNLIYDNYFNKVNMNITEFIGSGCEVNVLYSGNGTVNIEAIALLPDIPKNLYYIGIYINVTIIGTITYANITIKYTYSYITNIDPSNLRMYYWNETENKWNLCDNTGVDIVNHIIWANVTHLTIFAPMAEKALAPPTNIFIYVGIAIIAAIIVLVCVSISIKRGKKASSPEKT